VARRKQKRVLIVVQNLPVPFDRRVWLEATTLAGAGYAVSVICPKLKGYNASHETLEGVAIYRYGVPIDPSSKAGFVAEIIWAFMRTFFLSIRVALFGGGFDLIHACNPPETYWMLGRFWSLFGKRFIFDHHDLSPELFEVKFEGKKGFFHRLLLVFERESHRTAQVSIVTNESYKEVAVARGDADPDLVFVVRSGPDLNRFQRFDPDPSLKAGKPYLVAYLGEVGTQDGVDGLVRVARILRDDLGRDDVHFLVIGGGEHQPSIVALADTMGIADLFTFTGDVRDDERLCRLLSSADLGVDPVPKNAWSDRSTANKVVEYLYFGLPFVGYDLAEARRSAGDAGAYAEPGSEEDFARVIAGLLDDPDRRKTMGEVGIDRLESELAWQHSVEPLLSAYATAFGESPDRPS
jgi:glycosyltransferase involved in cell wall biosynthesis